MDFWPRPARDNDEFDREYVVHGEVNTLMAGAYQELQASRVPNVSRGSLVKASRKTS